MVLVSGFARPGPVDHVADVCLFTTDCAVAISNASFGTVAGCQSKIPKPSAFAHKSHLGVVV